MNTLLTTSFLLTLAAPVAPTPQQTQPWELDGAHTDVSFKVRHLAVSYTRGHFEALSGTLDIDEQDVRNSKVDIEIDVASIDTANDDRDEHLRSADFFDAAKFPKMRFVSTKVRRSGKTLRIDGLLTLHGVTKAVTLDVDELAEDV